MHEEARNMSNENIGSVYGQKSQFTFLWYLLALCSRFDITKDVDQQQNQIRPLFPALNQCLLASVFLC